MNQDHPELQQFLGAYFNQDWVDDHESANDVIDLFISESDSDTITKVQVELDRLILSKKTEQELKDYLFEEMSCYYYYRAVAGTECNTAIELKREQHDAFPSPL